MLSAVVVNDPAAPWAAEEDFLRLELAELGAELVVANAGALVSLLASAEVRDCIRK